MGIGGLDHGVERGHLAGGGLDHAHRDDIRAFVHRLGHLVHRHAGDLDAAALGEERPEQGRLVQHVRVPGEGSRQRVGEGSEDDRDCRADRD